MIHYQVFKIILNTPKLIGYFDGVESASKFICEMKQLYSDNNYYIETIFEE